MRKRIFNFAVLAAAASILASCASYEEIPAVADQEKAAAMAEELVPVTFTATFEQDEDTRTTLDVNDWMTKWTNTDQVTVFARYTKEKNADVFKSASIGINSVSGDGYTATFKGDIPKQVGYTLTEYYAIYPKGGEVESGKIKTSLATTQPAKVSSFADGVNLAAAKSTDTATSMKAKGQTLLFHNLCALLSFTVDTDIEIESATLTSNSGTAMSGGTAAIDFSGNTPSMKVTDAVSYVTLTGGLTNDTKYYFVVYPGTYSDGFTIEFEAKDGRKATMSSKKEITLEAKSNIFLGAITIPTVKWMPSEVGVYSTDGTPEYSYQQYNDQLVWSVSSSVNPDVYGFRIQKMDSRQFFDISGLPATYEVEGTSNVSITENISTDGKSTNTYKDTVKVISNDNGIVRLMGENHLYIIKTK